MTLDGALLRAQRRYPDAIGWRPTPTGRVLAVLDGGAHPAPVVAQRRAA
jgi:hypothetical protein